MKIEIENEEVREDIYSKDDKHIVFRKQKAFAHLDQLKYPVQINLNLFDNNPWPPGFYVIAGDSFKTDKYGNLVLKSFINLLKIKE